ncbi:MAG: hypothetical protein F6K40_29235, partial [Okeania sp. SIO3I5]|uniref:DnaB-like helicase N-terminal domain-containing protein n=1 Tax=Okeania sp. SIO3I5 TaxID=2607805 RepID=UPI0013BB6518
MQSDRLPPQNIEAEEAILGGILLDPEAISRVTQDLRPEFFAIQAHQIIYKAMWQLYNQGKPTDLMTVTSWLSDNNQFEKIGGQVKIVQLLERTVSAVNIDQYAALVVDKYIRRKLIQAGNEIFDLGFQTATKLETILDQAEQKIFALTQDKPQQDLVPISETLIDTFQEIEDRNEGVALPGLACGFYDLDAMTGGFQRSDLIIVAGRPSMGKCAAYDTLVLQKDGSLVTLAEVYQRQEIELLTLGKNRRFHLTKPSAFVDDGIKPVFRVTTKLGRFVETTITHPFLTVDGWKPLGKLEVGEKIAVPRRLDIFGNVTIPESEFSSLIDSDNFCLFPLVFKLERSQLALFIRYLFSLDGWMKISEDGGVCFGYSAVSEKFIRQVQHILLRFGIVAAIKKVEEKRSETKKVVKEFKSCFSNRYLSNSTEKCCFKRWDFRQNYFDKNLWYLTIIDPLSQKNFIADIGGFDDQNFDFYSSCLHLIAENNFLDEQSENKEIFWDELVSLMEKFAVPKSFSVKSRNGKITSPKNFENLTTIDTFYGKNFLADMESFPSENLDLGSDRLTLVRLENSWWDKLKSREIFCNEVLSLVDKFPQSKHSSVENTSIKRKSEKASDNLTTTDTFYGKNLLINMESFLLESLDFGSDRLALVRLENSWWDKLKSREIFWNELLSLVSKFSISKYQLLKSTSVKKTSEKTSNNLTTTDTFYGKNLLINMESLILENLDFGSDRLTLARLENSWWEKLESREIFWNELLSLMKNFPSENLDFGSDRLTLARLENSWWEKLESREIFWNELLSLMKNFPSENLDFGSDRLTLVRLENSWWEKLESLDFDWERLTLARLENSWWEKLESREIFWNELLSLVEKFAESKHPSVENRSVKKTSEKTSENFTTADTFCRKNLLAGMENFPLENLDFGSDRLTLVRLENSWWEKLESLDFDSERLTLARLENSWWEKLESREIFWNELLSLVATFAESKHPSVENRSVKKTSEKTSENFTTADTFCRKNLLAGMEN